MKQAGIIGYPVAHSLSPRMQQAAFDALGIVARYSHWETLPDSLAERIASLRSAEMLGVNVTTPYKQDVIPLIDECDPIATRIGAVNTIVNRDGRLFGYNTDAPGSIRALAEYPQHPFDSHGKKAVILGTSGAARAAAVALLENGVAELTLLGRTQEHRDTLLHHLHTLAAQLHISPRLHGAPLESPDATLLLSTADVLVNATSVGLQADDTTVLIDINALPTSALVMDMIFNPPTTALLRAAQAHGCHAFNGLSMLLYQGTLAFELWTGKTAPIEVMRKALDLSL